MSTLFCRPVCLGWNSFYFSQSPHHGYNERKAEEWETKAVWTHGKSEGDRSFIGFVHLINIPRWMLLIPVHQITNRLLNVFRSDGHLITSLIVSFRFLGASNERALPQRSKFVDQANFENKKLIVIVMIKKNYCLLSIGSTEVITSLLIPLYL